MRTHGMGCWRSQYPLSFSTCGLPWLATILWQPMQRSTDGTPAVLLRRALLWQYWQPICIEPAWITWLKKMGWHRPLALGGDRQHVVRIERGLGEGAHVGDDFFDLHVGEIRRESPA